MNIPKDTLQGMGHYYGLIKTYKALSTSEVVVALLRRMPEVELGYEKNHESGLQIIWGR
jgi:hypothetical protein